MLLKDYHTTPIINNKELYLMEILKIKGGTPLQGEVHISGAKNATTKLLVASLLSNKKCIFYNVPDIEDVSITVAMCQELGMEVEWDKKAGTMETITKELKSSYIPQRFSGSNRIPILMIGALLGRTTEDIIVPTVGGCVLGKRPVDFHLQALRSLGANIEYRDMKKEGAYFAHAHQGLKGTLIELPYPSVGATENTILASIRAKGTTVIKNAALEPEVIDLILFLQKLGANITLDVGRKIHIQGTQTFYEVEHTVVSDRIVAASFGMAAIATKGSVFVKNIEHLPMLTFLNKIREIGGGFKIRKEGIEFFYEKPLKANMHLETDVHPGFMTDWQQPFVVLLTQTEGSSIIHETVYENRFGYTNMLKKMGADITLFNQCLGGKPCRFASQDHRHSLIVKGPTPLKSNEIAIPDLRAGFAYVMAGLIAKGTSTIQGLPYLDRGYENLTEKLQNLNADIKRCKVKETNNSNKKDSTQVKKAIDSLHQHVLNKNLVGSGSGSRSGLESKSNLGS